MQGLGIWDWTPNTCYITPLDCHGNGLKEERSRPFFLLYSTGSCCGKNSLTKKRLFCEIASALCWKILCILLLKKFILKHRHAGSLQNSWKWHQYFTTAKKLPPVSGNHITDTLWVNCMLGYSGKWHQSSVGKFTVVYNVHINYAMTKIFVACVLLSL